MMSNFHPADYERIQRAILFIDEHRREQPSLEEMARSVHLSPYHFQRLFTRWAGVSPKKFLQYASLSRAKSMLKNNRLSLLETAYEVGLTGTGRLHDLFVTIEAMTPGEYKNGGESLTIRHAVADSPFGFLLVASTDRGICHMAFADGGVQRAVEELTGLYPGARHIEEAGMHDDLVSRWLVGAPGQTGNINLHVKGTSFQLKVWEALLNIPCGELASYEQVARLIGRPRAVRATGTAIANNPVAVLIPCHRVIRSTGAFGQYHWEPVRKKILIGWEASQMERSERDDG